MNNNLVPDSAIAIGDINFHLQAATTADCFAMDPAYGPFLTEARGTVTSQQPDVELKVHYSHPPYIDGAVEVFDAQGNWKLQEYGDTYVMSLSSPVFEPQLYKMLIIDKKLSRGDIYVTPGSATGYNSRSNPARRYPLQYPLDEVLTVSLLSQGRGVELHGLGIKYKGRGILFTGNSGAGKSTLAGLWQQRPGVTILSDDRLIVRRRSARDTLENCHAKVSRETKAEAESFYLFGTPWHGDAGVCAYGGVSLDRILILRQAPANQLVRLSASEAATALLVRCFPTFWDASGMEFTVDLIGCIAANIPCYELQFRPEPEALDTAIEGL